MEREDFGTWSGQRRVRIAALLSLLWLAPAHAQETDAPVVEQDGTQADSTTSAQAADMPAEAPAEPAAPVAESDSPAAPDATIPVVELKPATPPQTAESSEPVQLDDIEVTATKRPENLRDIPASIASISGDELEQRGAQDTADIVKLVPGVNLTSTGDSPQRVTIRGISSDIGTGPTAGVLFGNVSFTETYAPVVSLDLNPFDVASVDVLKGPQGTLYGAGALNGALRYVPEPPQYGVSEVKWFAQYTDVNQGDAAPTYGAAINLPLSAADLALRVVAFDRTAPGYVDNTRINVEDTNRIEQQGARALLGWKPGDAWDVMLTGMWQRTFIQDTGITDHADGTLETQNRPRQSPNHTEYSFFDFNLSYTGDWAQFVTDSSFVDKKGHNFFEASSRTAGTGAIPLVAQEYTGNSRTWAQEFRLMSLPDSDSRWKWAAGVFAYQQELQNNLYVPLAVDLTPLATIVDILALVNPALASLFTEDGSPLVVATAADVQVRELAAFGDLTRSFGEDESVEVSFGGRFYRTTSGGTNTQTGVTALALQGSSPFVLEDEVSEQGFNPKASVTWRVTEDVLTYGLVSKGFRVGGVQVGASTPLSQTPAPTTFKSDSLWNYEAGIRTQFLDNTLRLDLTGFHVVWDQPQTLQSDASGLVVYMDNVGGVHSTGADLAVQYIFPWGMLFKGGASYAKTVTSTDFSTSNGTLIPAGSPWPLAPEWQTSSSLSYQAPIGDWTLGGFITYSTLGPTIPFFTGEKIFDYGQLDLQFNLSNPGIPWLPQVALILNNLTDERGKTNAFSSGVPSDQLAAREYYYITPRSITLRLMGRFGG